MKSPTSTAGSGITVGGVTPEEDQHLRALGDALAVVPGWEYLDSQPSGAWRVEAGSDLAGDDAAIHPYPVSSAARTAISAGICRGQGAMVLARSAGVDTAQIRKGPGYREIAETVGSPAPSALWAAVAIWKACSAIAHGTCAAWPPTSPSKQ